MSKKVDIILIIPIGIVGYYMRFSVKSDYAVTAVLDMALNADKGPVHVKAIAERQSIPVRFLEQVMASLKKAGLVESIRGSQGGYILARDPQTINIAQIVEAVDGPIMPVDYAVGAPEYRNLHANGHVVKEVWEEAWKAVMDVLNRINIQEMCHRKKRQETAVMYHI